MSIRFEDMHTTLTAVLEGDATAVDSLVAQMRQIDLESRANYAAWESARAAAERSNARFLADAPVLMASVTAAHADALRMQQQLRALETKLELACATLDAVKRAHIAAEQEVIDLRALLYAYKE